jgi:phosphoglycolate phosphatase-like HAD superfamily hydrolase
MIEDIYKTHHEHRKIILLDLDGTLYDNQKTRHRAIAQSLSLLRLNKKLIHSLADYEVIVELSEGLERLGFHNFRHVWSCKELYAIIMVLFSRNKSHLQKLDIEESDQVRFLSSIKLIQKSVLRPMNIPGIASQRFPLQIKKFIGCVNKISFLPIFKHAHRLFEGNLKLSLTKGVAAFLNHIQKAVFEAYIITEGYPEIQLRKVRELGLMPLFKNRVLTTGDAAKPRGWGALQGKIAYLEKKVMLGSASARDKEDLKILNAKAHTLLQYNDKSNPYFYGRILNAIVADRSNPINALRGSHILSSEQWVASGPPKVAMIGDRYDKDLHPIMKLVGKKQILTVRFLHGKHSSSHLAQSLPPRYRPHFSSDSFAVIGKYLLDSKNWDSIDAIAAPPEIMRLSKNTVLRFQNASSKARSGLFKKAIRMANAADRNK